MRPAAPWDFAAALARIARHEDINFLLTNRIPRRAATRFVGWLSRIDNPRLARALIALWRLFDPTLDLTDAEPQEYRSLQDCFTRRLRAGARPVHPDPHVLVSPCDAIVGECGMLDDRQCLQAKGFPYAIDDLLLDPVIVAKHRHGRFVTLRLTASMYHRFHAPCDGQLADVQYVSGDTWNVNPIALRRVEALFCKNERLVLDLTVADPEMAVTLVPVAAILVASLVVHGLPEVLDLQYRGPTRMPCARTFAKGDELGYFRNGSTILVFATGNVTFSSAVRPGARIRMGEPLLLSLGVPLSHPPAVPRLPHEVP
jgi:phosphatidylserine decarboxylase